MLRTVRLELARCRDFPEGSPTHGYELRIPLDARGKLDVGEMPAHRHETTFRRFWGGEDETDRVHHGLQTDRQPDAGADSDGARE